jgi:predicted nucleotidyltransferase
MDQKEAINISKEFLFYLIESGYRIKEAFLFGSYAKNKFNDDSDIDLAIVIDNLHNSYDEMIKMMKLRRKFTTKIEPHPFDYFDFKNNNPYTNEILKNGIKLV